MEYTYKCNECGNSGKLEDLPHYKIYDTTEDGDIVKDAISYCPNCESEVLEYETKE